MIFKRNNIVGKIYFNMDKVTRKKNTVLKTTSQNEGETYKTLLKIKKHIRILRHLCYFLFVTFRTFKEARIHVQLYI